MPAAGEWRDAEDERFASPQFLAVAQAYYNDRVLRTQHSTGELKLTLGEVAMLEIEVRCSRSSRAARPWPRV